MHIAVKIVLVLIALIVAGTIGMASTGFCPPAGPWPQPPWCSSGSATGIPATVPVYVSAPPSSADGAVMFVPEGGTPIAMTRAGSDGWTTSLQAKTGDSLSYRYFFAGKSSAGTYSARITRPETRLNDGVWGWQGDPFRPQFSKDFSVGLFMSDTWGRNYNMMMMEDTRANIDTSFEQAAKTGASEVYVTDFQRAIFNNATADWVTDANYHYEGDIFANDMRDEAMTQEDMNRLAASAHKNGMKIGWKTSVHFVDIGKYIASGVSGTIGKDTAADWELWSKTPRTSAWTRVYFARYRAMLLEKAAMLNAAGFDEMIITPGWHTPNFHPVEKEANELWKETIRDVKATFKGRVGVVLDTYGFMDGKNADEDWTQYDYYTAADNCYYFLYTIPTKYVTSQDTDKSTLTLEFNAYLDTLEQNAKAKNIKIRIVPGIFSYKGGIIANRFDIDPLDINNPAVKSAQPDWIGQADAYDALFTAAEGREWISGIIPNGFAWDESMDPGIPAKLSIGIQYRTKPAEGVITKWAQAVKAST
ncbi:MAG: hypothetical protein Q8N94_00020 [Methanoregula sp.]|nr:hypothetical protein [Methanoregula sp.]